MQFLTLAALNKLGSAAVGALAVQIDIERTAMGENGGVFGTRRFGPIEPSPTGGTPEEQGMDSKELAKVVDFGAPRVLSSTGATPSSQLDSLLVARHGKIVAEAYYAPYAAGILHQVNSVTKAVTSTLTAIAAKDGLLDSTSHRILDFFDPAGKNNVDPRKDAIPCRIFWT